MIVGKLCYCLHVKHNLTSANFPLQYSRECSSDSNSFTSPATRGANDAQHRMGKSFVMKLLTFVQDLVVGRMGSVKCFTLNSLNFNCAKEKV